MLALEVTPPVKGICRQAGTPGAVNLHRRPRPRSTSRSILWVEAEIAAIGAHQSAPITAGTRLDRADFHIDRCVFSATQSCGNPYIECGNRVTPEICLRYGEAAGCGTHYSQGWKARGGAQRHFSGGGAESHNGAISVIDQGVLAKEGHADIVVRPSQRTERRGLRCYIKVLDPGYEYLVGIIGEA